MGRWGAAGVGWLPGCGSVALAVSHPSAGARAWLVVPLPASARARRRRSLQAGLGGRQGQLWLLQSESRSMPARLRMRVRVGADVWVRWSRDAMQRPPRCAGQETEDPGGQEPRTHEWCVAYARAGLVRGHRGTAQLPRVNAAVGSGRGLGTRELAVAAGTGSGSGSACLLYPADSLASDRGNDGREGITCFAPVAGRGKKRGPPPCRRGHRPSGRFRRAATAYHRHVAPAAIDAWRAHQVLPGRVRTRVVIPTQ